MKTIFLLLVLLFSPRQLGSAGGVRTVLVFPFENLSGRSDLNWISETFPEILSSRLASPRNYALDRDERNAAYAQLEIPPGAPLTLASEYKVAETLGVDWAVTGWFDVEGERLTVHSQLLDVRQLKLKPAIDLTGELADLVDLQSELAWRILASSDASFTVGNEDDFRRRFPDVRLDAFENYTRGVLATDDVSRVRFLREADRLNPADHRAAFELGRFYFDGKDYASSVEWLRKVGEADRDYQEALFRLGVDEFFLGHLETAENDFETLARQVPLNEVWSDLGVVKAHRGRYADALEDFRRAYEEDSTDPDFSFNLGACLWYLAKYDESAKYLKQALQENDDDPGAHALLAMVLGKLGDAEGQRRELQWLADREGGSMGKVEEDILPQARLKKNYDGRAFRLLSLAISNDLESQFAAKPPAVHADAHLARGKTFLAEKRFSEAEPELVEAISLHPGSGEAHLTLGQVYESEGRHADAAREFETSLRLKDGVAAHLGLARAYLSLGKPEAARAQGQAALELDPRNREAAQLMEQIRARTSPGGRTP